MAKQERYINPDCHRPVNWNEKAVLKAIKECGYVFVQIKEDGFRFHAFLDNTDTVRIVTREGIEIRSLAVAATYLYDLLSSLPDGFVVDGEATIPGIPFEEASGHLRRFELVQLPVLFYVWDTFPMTALLGTAAYDETYDQRLNRLVWAWQSSDTDSDKVQCVTCETVQSLEEANTFFDDARAKLKEGLVVKRPDLPVINGKRSGQWKMKPSDNCDGRIVGAVWGTPGLGNAGKIIGFTVELEDGTLCDATNITQAQMAEFTGVASVQGVGPFMGRYAEVSYMEKTAAGSLRHPSFVAFRDLDYAPGWKS